MNANAQAAVDAVDIDEIVDLAKQLILIPSFKGDESDCARFIVDYLAARGFEAELQGVEPGRYNAIGRLRGSALRPGSGREGKSLMLDGHMDIDPLARGWKRDPWVPTIEGDRLYGAGIANMKAGVASMIGAADAVRRSGIQLSGDIVIAGVVGELQGGVGTKYVCDNGPRTDVAIVPEPVGADAIVTCHAGWVQSAVHILGSSRHIGEMEEGTDALRLSAKAIDALYATEFTFEPHPKLPGVPRLLVGAATGGQGRDHDLKGPNYVCDFFTLLVDVRFVPNQTPASVEADLRRALDAVKASDPSFDYELELPAPPSYRVAYEVMPPFELPPGEPILDAVTAAYRAVTGQEPDIGSEETGGVDDTGHLMKAGIPCVLYGPCGLYDYPEGPDMYSLISEMERSAKVMAAVAADICA